MYNRCVWVSKWLKVSLIRLWQWVKDQIVREVPEDLVLCEYDCRKEQRPWANGRRAIGVSTTARESLCHVVAILRRNREMRLSRTVLFIRDAIPSLQCVSGVPRLKTKLGAGGDSGRTFCL